MHFVFFPSEGQQYSIMQLCKQKGLDCCRKCFCEIILEFYLLKHILRTEYTNTSFRFTLVFLLVQFCDWRSHECWWQHKDSRREAGMKPAAQQDAALGNYSFLLGAVCVKFKSSWFSKLIRQYLVILLLQQSHTREVKQFFFLFLFSFLSVGEFSTFSIIAYILLCSLLLNVDSSLFSIMLNLF